MLTPPSHQQQRQSPQEQHVDSVSKELVGVVHYFALYAKDLSFRSYCRHLVANKSILKQLESEKKTFDLRQHRARINILADFMQNLFAAKKELVGADCLLPERREQLLLVQMAKNLEQHGKLIPHDTLIIKSDEQAASLAKLIEGDQLPAIPEDTRPTYDLNTAFIFKTIKMTDHYWSEFINELVHGEKTRRRTGPREPYTFRLDFDKDGKRINKVVLTPGEDGHEPLYPKELKEGFTKHQAATYAEPKSGYCPQFFLIARHIL